MRYAVVAQLVRALPCHGRGCGFEPRRLRNQNRKVPGYVIADPTLWVYWKRNWYNRKMNFDEKIKTETLTDSGQNIEIVKDVTKNIKKITPFKFDTKNGEPSIEWEYSTMIDGDMYTFTTGIYLLSDAGGNCTGKYFDIDFTVNGNEDLINKDVFKRAKIIRPIISALLKKSSNYSVDSIRISASSDQGSKKEIQRINLYQRVMDSLGFKLLNKSDDGQMLFYEKPSN